MGILKLSACLGCVFLLFCSFCTSTVVPFSPLPKPTIQSAELTVSDKFQEAIHINWTIPQNEVTDINTFTLLRMVEGDTFFSVHSENIPADTLNFYDPLEPSIFPSSSAEKKSVYYRIFPIDELGRSGDTSDACTLWLVQQPTFNSIDLSTGCLSWYSNIHFGGLLSFCRIWKDSLQNCFTGSEQLLFPSTDKSAVFNACFSKQIFSAGRWQYAIFLKSADTRSLSIGYFDVP